MTNIYVTKWALTQGVLEMDARKVDGETGYAYVGEAGRIESQLFFPKEWYFTKEEAIKDARRRIIAKIRSIEKQTVKLRELDDNLAKEQKTAQ